MSVPTLHESDVEELDIPGRRLRWLVADDRIKAENCAVCVIRVAPGDTVRAAHSHPEGEEVIYIMTGSGRVLVDGEVPQGKPQMLHNTGDEEMKVVCFFAPATSLANYRIHEDVDFPD